MCIKLQTFLDLKIQYYTFLNFEQPRALLSYSCFLVKKTVLNFNMGKLNVRK